MELSDKAHGSYRLAQLIFILLVMFIGGVFLFYVADYTILRSNKVFSLEYALSILAPNALLIIFFYKLLPNRLSQTSKLFFIQRLSPRKRAILCASMSATLISFAIFYLAYIPHPNILVLQTSVFILALMEILVVFLPEMNLSGPYIAISTLIFCIVFLEIASRLLIGAGNLGLLKALSANDNIAYLDYGDVHQQPTDGLFREGGKLVPNLDVMVVGETRDQPVRFITNSKGFRNTQEFSYQPSPDVYRILYVGDSFVAGYRVGQESTSGKVIEDKLTEMLRAAGSQLRPEVLIVSISEPATAWFWLEEYGFKYHPDLIILGVTLGNDIFQTYLAVDPKGYLTITNSEDSMSIGNYVKPEIGFTTPPINRLYLPTDAFAFGSNSGGLSDFLWRTLCRLKAKILWTSLGGFVSQAINSPVAIDSWYQDTEPGKVYAFDLANGLGLFYTPEIEQIEESFKRLEIVIQGMKRRSYEHQSDFLLVFFPQRFQVTDQEWQLTQESYVLNPEHFNLEYPNQRLVNLCKQNEVDCLDLLPHLQHEATLQTHSLYLPAGDMHWNSDGHRVAGTHMAEFIWEKYLEDQTTIK